MEVRDATQADLPRILEITNQAILTGTALWYWQPTTLEARRAWLLERQGRGYPVLVAGERPAEVLGFASFGDFRPADGYLYTVEHSVYVDPAAQRRGVGSALLTELIERAARADKHVMIAGIESENEASLRLHERFGFEQVGQLRQVGWKFDRWLDLVLMQRFVNQ